MLDSGFIDTYRYFNPEQTDAFTWWSYRIGVREKNIGWRIDYFICSKSVISKVTDVKIYKEVLGSDHCPIGISVTLK